MFIGDRLRQIRIERNYTQQELADALEVSSRQISRYETGESDPTAGILFKFSAVLGVSVDYLLGITSEPWIGLETGELHPKERAVLSAWRRGEKLEAVKLIVTDNDDFFGT